MCYGFGKFFTGAVKITPAHDFNDYDLGLRHNLQPIDVIDADGNMVNVPSKYLVTSFA